MAHFNVLTQDCNLFLDSITGIVTTAAGRNMVQASFDTKRNLQRLRRLIEPMQTFIGSHLEICRYCPKCSTGAEGGDGAVLGDKAAGACFDMAMSPPDTVMAPVIDHVVTDTAQRIEFAILQCDDLRTASIEIVTLRRDRMQMCFAIVATIFLPLTFLTSWMGMNFPEIAQCGVDGNEDHCFFPEFVGFSFAYAGLVILGFLVFLWPSTSHPGQQQDNTKNPVQDEDQMRMGPTLSSNNQWPSLKKRSVI
jgi:Mg2+ and Co2+ transporter CorA